MSWVLWFWLWSCIRPGETLLDVLLNVRIYDPDTPVSSHLYSFAVGIVGDETDVLAGVEALVKDNSVVVVDEVRHGRENFVALSKLANIQSTLFPSSVSKGRAVWPSFLMRLAAAET